MEAQCVFSGEAVMAAVCKHPPHVVVLDIMVTGHGGPDILRRMKTGHPDIQVILLAGKGSFMNGGLLSMQHDACDYFTKPLDLNQLVEAILNLKGGASAAQGKYFFPKNIKGAG